MKHAARLLVLPLAFASLALAEEAGEKDMTGWKWANFAILAAGIGYLLVKQAGPYFAARSTEIRKGINGKIGDHLERIRTFNVDIHHVVRLIEKNAGFPPRALLVAPIREFGRDNGINVGADLRITQHIDGISHGF